MKFQLRPYLIPIIEQGKEILQKYHIVYLAMETRTGKTLAALTIAYELGFKRILFTTKLKAIGSIKSDVKKLTDAGYDLEATVINFESLHKVKGRPDIIIIDEAHSLGAFPKPSIRTKRLRVLAAQLPIIYLSATPTPESYSQIYHQLWVSSFSPFKNIVNRHGVPSFYSWAHKTDENGKSMYVTIKEIRIGGGSKCNDYSHADRKAIKAATGHLFLTFTQAQAGFTQVVEEQVHLVPMAPAVDVIIKRLINDRVVEVDAGDGVFEIVADTPVRLQSLHHQLSSGSVIDDSGCYRVLDYSKAIYIKDNFDGSKAVFYKFKSEKTILLAIFPHATESPEDFENGKSDIIVLQYVSGREGIDLRSAKHTIFFNIDYSYLSYSQSMNRFQSLHRDTPAIIHFLFNASPLGIEQKIMVALKKKSNYTSVYYKKDYITKNNLFD